MKMLGLNPMEQEIVDLTNEIAKNGLIYFPEFCKVVKTRYRSDDEEVFRQNFFKVGKQLNWIMYDWKYLDLMWYRSTSRTLQSQEVQDP